MRLQESPNLGLVEFVDKLSMKKDDCYEAEIVAANRQQSLSSMFDGYKLSVVSDRQKKYNWLIEIEVAYNDYPLILYHDIPDKRLDRDVDLDRYGCTLTSVPIKNHTSENLLLVVLATSTHNGQKFVHQACLLDLTTYNAGSGTHKLCTYISATNPTISTIKPIVDNTERDYYFEVIIYDTTTPSEPQELSDSDSRVKRSTVIQSIITLTRRYQHLLNKYVDNQYKFNNVLHQYIGKRTELARGNSCKKLIVAGHQYRFQLHSEAERDKALQQIGAVIDFSDNILTLEFPIMSPSVAPTKLLSTAARSSMAATTVITARMLSPTVADIDDEASETSSIDSLMHAAALSVRGSGPDGVLIPNVTTIEQDVLSSTTAATVTAKPSLVLSITATGESTIVTLSSNGVICVNDAPVPSSNNPLSSMLLSINSLIAREQLIRPKGSETVDSYKSIGVTLSPDSTLKSLYILQQTLAIYQSETTQSADNVTKQLAAKLILAKFKILKHVTAGPLKDRSYKELLQLAEIRPFPAALLDAYLDVQDYVSRTF